MIRPDVAIVGAGPAGCATALAVARAGFSVAVLEKRHGRRAAAAETLPPASLTLLHHVLGQGSEGAPWAHRTRGHVSAWGDDTPRVQDFIFTPAGHGLCVDRAGFDDALRQATREAGAEMLVGAELIRCQKAKAGWRLDTSVKRRAHRQLAPRHVVDATGRASAVSRHLGLTRSRADALFALALRFEPTTGAGPGAGDPFVRVEACPYGWWYSAALPGGSGARMVVLHTDADLPEMRRASTVPGFLSLLVSTQVTMRALVARQYRPTGTVKGAQAHGTAAAPDWPAGFLAVGDAAQAYDPLSSQGLTHALRTGATAGQSLVSALAGTAGCPGYRLRKDLGRAWDTYLAEHIHYYSTETRWPDAPFWARRQTRHFHEDRQRECL